MVFTDFDRRRSLFSRTLVATVTFAAVAGTCPALASNGAQYARDTTAVGAAAKKAPKKPKKPKKNPLDPKRLPKAPPCAIGPGATCDGASVSQADIRGKDLSGASFRFVNFERMDLTGTNFEGARLLGANFRGANLTNVNFAGAGLSFARLKGAVVVGANFAGADLALAELPDGRTRDIICFPIGQKCPSDDLPGAN